MGLSNRAYAAHRKALGLTGTSEGAVRKAALAGRIPRLKDGTIDPAAADAAWAGATDVRKVRGPGADASTLHLDDTDERAPVIVASPTAGMDVKTAGTFNDIRIKREVMKLKKEIREDKKEEKLLMPREPALKKVFELALAMRSAVEAWPDFGGPELAARFGVSEHEFVQALRDSMREMLTEMSKENTDVSG